MAVMAVVAVVASVQSAAQLESLPCLPLQPACISAAIRGLCDATNAVATTNSATTVAKPIPLLLHLLLLL